MARPIKFSQKELSRAKDLRDNYKNERECRAAACFLLMALHGLTRENVAEVFGVTPKTVSDDIERIRHPETRNKGDWGGARNCLMTLEKEAQFLQGFLNMSKAGLVITMPEVNAEYNKLVGKETPKSTFDRLLKRHEWRKVLPDTRHPQGNPEVQEEFKKNSQDSNGRS
jgi:transposase